MREKRQLEEAQRREEDAAHIEEPLDPISDGNTSGIAIRQLSRPHRLFIQKACLI